MQKLKKNGSPTGPSSARRRCRLAPTAARRRTRPPHDAAPPPEGPAFAPCCTTVRAPPLSACRAPAATLHLRTGASPTCRRLLTGCRVLLLRPLQPGRRAPLLRLPCTAAASTPPASASPAACPSSATRFCSLLATRRAHRFQAPAAAPPSSASHHAPPARRRHAPLARRP